MREAVHFWVTGRVQGVSFRAHTQTKALALGLTGWVRNLPDGQVEGVACGDPHSLKRLAEWLAVGPSFAKVTHLEIQSETPQQWFNFEIE
jgi:acylphosphatase